MRSSQVPIDDVESLGRLLYASSTLLLDFDGPVCSVFAGFPANEVASQLREVLAEGGYRTPPPDVEKSDDPFDIFEYSAALGEDEALLVETALRAHEVEAIGTATPTPFAHDLIRGWSERGRRLAIVSNNSSLAVRAYLDLHGLTGHVTLVSARSSSNPKLLKPNPYLVNRALTSLGADPGDVNFVGDSRSDIESARRAGVHAIAYANKTWKIEPFQLEGPAALITNMSIMNSVIKDAL